MLRKLIDEKYLKNGSTVMYDGIINEEIYNKTTPKILWILKEPYDHNEITENWDTTSDINQGHKVYFTIKTWRKIAIVSFGIINKISYDEVFKNDDSKISEILKSIAYINLSKNPAGTTSQGRSNFFNEVYADCKDVLFKQIEHFKPDVLIFGNTFEFFMKDLEFDWKKYLSDVNSIPNTKMSVFRKESERKVYIDAYHPASFKYSEEIYCNSIISVALKNLEF